MGNPHHHKTFDFIIVGAGSAGATVAARLAENASCRVCLLEAGSRDTHPLIHIPFGLALLSRIKKLNWNYTTTPQEALNHRELYWPRGKTMGGSSSVNAMCYIRGDWRDYEKWPSLGAAGWDWQSVLPYFKKAESQQHGASALHGANGPLRVEDLRHHDVLSEAFVAAAEELGLPNVADFNAKEREGLGFYQVTQRRGRRCSAAKAYLDHPALSDNLTIITQATVERVRFNQTRATGVELRLPDGEQTIVHAQKEVIVCGGAINSPQLLMLSGVGPATQLQQHGITPVVNLPGVGQNLQDHLDVIIQHRCQAHEGYAADIRALPKYIRHGIAYLRQRNGLFSSNIAEAGGFVRSRFARGRADLQYHFIPAILHDHGRSTAFGYGYGLHVCNLYPKSRGQVTLRSAKADEPPLIDPCYLTNQDDLKITVDGVRQARQILASTAFHSFRGREVLPGPNVKSDSEITEFIRQHGESIYHPVGTCKMGAEDDPATVVSPQLTVKGTENLRVVDASVIPELIGGNTNAPVIMIAERAADLIKKAHGYPH